MDQFKERKIEILNKARALFAKHGYRRCTTEDIAKACGLTKAALYHYFKNKEEIFTEVVSRESTMLLEGLEKTVFSHDDPVDQLHTFILTRFRKIRDLLNLYQVSLSTAQELMPFVQKCRERFFTLEAEMLASILKRGVTNGKFRKVKIDLVARTMIVAFKGVDAHLLTVENEKTVVQAMKEILDILSYGLLKPRTRGE